MVAVNILMKRIEKNIINVLQTVQFTRIYKIASAVIFFILFYYYRIIHYLRNNEYLQYVYQ